MTLATILSRGTAGIQAPQVIIEVHLSNGLPGLSIVGLPEAAVKESKDRVRSAILNSRFEFPARRITINLAPADVPKEGSRFDLAIAVGILAASGQIPAHELNQLECLGELSLSGELRPIQGVLPASIACQSAGRTLIAPVANLDEAVLVDDAQVIGAHHLLDVCAHLTGQSPLTLHQNQSKSEPLHPAHPDYADVQGQAHAKRALEIAACGGHNLIMVGPPGTGKSMLAHRFPGILPPLSQSEALQSAAVYSISGHALNPRSWRQPPFRSPHHTASAVALVGGGRPPKPGEISLAHHGVLFLDELPEFDRKVLEVLREPLEQGQITISRAAEQADFPAQFQLIAAMNPCPCGHLGDQSGRCRCTTEHVSRYRSRISGPLLDRIDMHIEVPRMELSTRQDMPHMTEESSAQIQSRVKQAQLRARKRQHRLNHALTPTELKVHCNLAHDDQTFLEQAIKKLALSHRAYHRILRVARTIADMVGADQIEQSHLVEALSYRRLDRQTT